MRNRPPVSQEEPARGDGEVEPPGAYRIAR